MAAREAGTEDEPTVNIAGDSDATAKTIAGGQKERFVRAYTRRVENTALYSSGGDE